MLKPLVLLDLPLPPFLQEQLEPHCEIRPWKLFQETDGAEIKRIEGIYTYAHPVVDGRMLDRLPALKVISNFGVGVDHIDLNAAAARRIPVGNTPGAVDGATADMTMALLLAAARNLVIGDRFARGPEYTHHNPSLFLGAEVFGSTLGIVGMGRVGSAVARRARGFEMRILYHNRRRNQEVERALAAEYVTLLSLLSQSHFVSLNVPLTSETRHLIGETELRMMRRDAILINISRGPVVDHFALYRALKEGWIEASCLQKMQAGKPAPQDIRTA